jgi:tetratricopeptide (TPR) repeat protein
MKKLLALASILWLLYGSAVFAAPGDAVERNAAGTKLLDQGKIEAAIAEFEKAVAVDPTYIPAQLNLGYGYERANRIDDAVNVYRKTITLDPSSFFAHNNLGVLYDRKGLYDQAIAEFQNALKARPGDPMTQKNLETAQKNKTTAQERERQIARAQKQVQANPTDVKAAYQLARIYAIHGMKEPALEWLRKAVREGFKDFAELKADPGFSSLRDEREFSLLLIGK